MLLFYYLFSNWVRVRWYIGVFRYIHYHLNNKNKNIFYSLPFFTFCQFLQFWSTFGVWWLMDLKKENVIIVWVDNRYIALCVFLRVNYSSEKKTRFKSHENTSEKARSITRPNRLTYREWMKIPKEKKQHTNTITIAYTYYIHFSHWRKRNETKFSIAATAATAAIAPHAKIFIFHFAFLLDTGAKM